MRASTVANEQTTSKRKVFRRVIRELLAIAFWTHALYVTQFIPLPHLPVPELPRYVFNTVLLIFIANYSLFSNNGWWSVAFDLVYVYSLPFIYTGRVAWFVAKSTYSTLKERTVIKPPQLIFPTPDTRPPANTPDPNANTAKTESKDRDGILYRISKFTLLWSIFIFTVNFRPSLVIVVLFTVFGAMRAFRALWTIFSGESDGTLKIEEALQKVIKANLDKIINWDGLSEQEDIKNKLNSLKLYESVFNFVHDNRLQFLKWSFVVSLIISVPFYLYMSYLFACSYVGIGKIAGEPFPFSTAILDSLYMPFAWTELPKMFSIRLMGGIQAILMSAVGYTIFFRHFGTRFESILHATGRLRGPLDDELVRQKIVQVQSLLANDTRQLPAEGATEGQ